MNGAFVQAERKLQLPFFAPVRPAQVQRKCACGEERGNGVPCKKSEVQDKMNDWVAANDFWLQCRAYAVSVKCADEFLAANCGAKKAEAGEGVPAPHRPEQVRGSEVGDFPPDTLPSGEGPERASPTALAEEKPADAPIDPQRCCYTVKDYRFHANARGEAFCKAAKKNLTPCPF